MMTERTRVYGPRTGAATRGLMVLGTLLACWSPLWAQTQPTKPFEVYWMYSGDGPSKKSLDTGGLKFEMAVMSFEHKFGLHPIQGPHMIMRYPGGKEKFYQDHFAAVKKQFDEWQIPDVNDRRILTLDFEAWLATWIFQYNVPSSLPYDAADQDCPDDWRDYIREFEPQLLAGKTPAQQEQVFAARWIETVREYWERNIREIRRLRPNMPIGLYGFPQLGYDAPKYPEVVAKKTYQMEQELPWLVDLVDILMPCVYPYSESVPGTPDFTKNQCAYDWPQQYIGNEIAWAKKYARGKLVMPWISMTYCDLYHIQFPDHRVNDFDMRAQFNVPLQAGADGVFVFMEVNNMAYINTYANPFMKNQLLPFLIPYYQNPRVVLGQQYLGGVPRPGTAAAAAAAGGGTPAPTPTPTPDPAPPVDTTTGGTPGASTGGGSTSPQLPPSDVTSTPQLPPTGGTTTPELPTTDIVTLPELPSSDSPTGSGGNAPTERFPLMSGRAKAYDDSLASSSSTTGGGAGSRTGGAKPSAAGGSSSSGGGGGGLSFGIGGGGGGGGGGSGVSTFTNGGGSVTSSAAPAPAQSLATATPASTGSAPSSLSESIAAGRFSVNGEAVGQPGEPMMELGAPSMPGLSSTQIAQALQRGADNQSAVPVTPSFDPSAIRAASGAINNQNVGAALARSSQTERRAQPGVNAAAVAGAIGRMRINAADLRTGVPGGRTSRPEEVLAKGVIHDRPAGAEPAPEQAYSTVPTE